jgi:alkane 1-monooxygenase
MNLSFLKYSSALISCLAIFVSIYAGGIWSYFALVYAFVLIPVLELVIPGSEENMSKIEEDAAKKDIKYDILLWLIVPIQLGLMVFFLYRVSQPGLAWWEILGFISAFGVSCGVFGINVAHELGHRNTWHEQLMSKILLMTSMYMHFFVEHNRGHHKNVSTDEDPASSRYGETVYAFWIRSVVNSYISAWKLEIERMAKLGLPALHWKNEMVWYQVIQASVLAIIYFAFGWKTLLFYLATAVIGFLLLETVNYIEHYGLRRKLIDGAYYEKVQPVHSWNSNHPLGRLLLFELTRHSDHHYMASRKYQVLRHFDQSPQMPTGYPGMMVLSLFPPLWFYVMHRHIAEYKQTEAGASLA